MSAIDQTTTMAISDEDFLDLYNNDSAFKTWCNTKVQVAEIHELAIKLSKNIIKGEIHLQNTLVEILPKVNLGP